MSRRSDRLGIAPESLSNPQTPRWMEARALKDAAGWRKRYARDNDRRERASAVAWHRYEIGMARSRRTFNLYAQLP